jgi:hypothetical protein
LSYLNLSQQQHDSAQIRVVQDAEIVVKHRDASTEHSSVAPDVPQHEFELIGVLEHLDSSLVVVK